MDYTADATLTTALSRVPGPHLRRLRLSAPTALRLTRQRWPRPRFGLSPTCRGQRDCLSHHAHCTSPRLRYPHHCQIPQSRAPVESTYPLAACLEDPVWRPFCHGGWQHVTARK